MASRSGSELSASDIPDRLKGVRWWKLQNDIAEMSQKSPDSKAMRLMLQRQDKMLREMHEKLQQETND